MNEYNASREPLILREYGRNLQNLVQKLSTIDDKSVRTQHANALLKSMAILDANGKSKIDNPQKRWDDLCIISDYTLEVDSPYPVPEKGILNQHTARPAYVKGAVKFRSYGRNVERLIQQAIQTTDEELQAQMVVSIIKLMKRLGNTWNGDVDANTILTHFQQLAGNQLPVDRERI
mgnify:CR=1 FL=1